MSIVPGTNEAPGLFSTTNATPICADSCCVRIRISTPTEPPGADGTTKRMGFSGYAACAGAANAASRTTARIRALMSYPNAMKGEPCSQNTLRIQCVNQATGFPDRTCRRYHYASAFTSNQDLKMAQPLPGMKPRPDQTLSLNMKLLSHHELQGFGGIGEGMGMQLAKDGRRILWMAHESAPKNFTAVDVTDPKNPRVVVQTELPHAKVRSNSLDVVGDIMAVAYQTSAVNTKPAGFDLFDIGKPENPRLISHFDASGAHSRDVRKPVKPEEVGRWWLPGTRVGDSTPPLARHPKFDSGYRAHNTNVFPQRPDRAYVGYIS